MKQTALVTGASNGIGLELAKIHAQKGGDVVLVARSKEKLEQLAQELTAEYGGKAWVIAQDLSESNAAQAIFTQTEVQGITVDILINNTSFGGHGRFFERELAKEQQMIQVNITTLIELSQCN